MLHKEVSLHKYVIQAKARNCTHESEANGRTKEEISLKNAFSDRVTCLDLEQRAKRRRMLTERPVAKSTESGRVKRIGRRVAGNYARSRYPQLRGNGAQKSAIPARRGS